MTGYWLPLAVALWIYLAAGIGAAAAWWVVERHVTDPQYERQMERLEREGVTRPVLYALVVLRWPLVVRLLWKATR